MKLQTLISMIDERREELFSLLTSLIRINSENFGSTGNEKEVAAYIHDLCLKMGLDSRMYTPLEVENMREHPDYFPGRDLKNRYNVTAVLRGETDENGLALLAHLDTEPIGDPRNWDFDPLGGEIIDGKICGRGACDDKYAVATALFVLKLLTEAGYKPKKNLVVTAYGDEERGGSHGAMAASLLYPSERIVSMDGNSGELWNCASGGGNYAYRFHTSVPVNGVGLTAKGLPIIMEEIERFGDARRQEMGANPYCQGTVIPESALRFMHAFAGHDYSDWGSGEVAFTYYTDKTREVIKAELAEVDARITARLSEIGLEGEGFTPTTRFFHYGAAAPDCDAIVDLLAASREAVGKEPIVCGSCLSDLSIILKHGSPNAFGFGYGRQFSEVGGPHQPNESIDCDALVEYTKIIAAYVLRSLGGAD